MLRLCRDCAETSLCTAEIVKKVHKCAETSLCTAEIVKKEHKCAEIVLRLY